MHRPANLTSIRLRNNVRPGRFFATGGVRSVGETRARELGEVGRLDDQPTDRVRDCLRVGHVEADEGEPDTELTKSVRPRIASGRFDPTCDPRKRTRLAGGAFVVVHVVGPLGLEPRTCGLRVRCSIRLS